MKIVGYINVAIAIEQLLKFDFVTFFEKCALVQQIYLAFFF